MAKQIQNKASMAIVHLAVNPKPKIRKAFSHVRNDIRLRYIGPDAIIKSVIAIGLSMVRLLSGVRNFAAVFVKLFGVDAWNDAVTKNYLAFWRQYEPVVFMIRN